MTKREQIEEIGEYIAEVSHLECAIKSCEECKWCGTNSEKADCTDYLIAEKLTEKGYRKTDEEEIDAIKKGMHFLIYSMCLKLNLEREIYVKYKIQLNNWFENYKKTQNIGVKMDGKE